MMCTRTSTPTRRERARRGVAMMLVVIAVAIGTVIAAAALTMNDTSAIVGANAISSSQSEWSAKSASRTVVAAMQTEADWKSLIESDVLLDNWTINGSSVDVSVTALDGSPMLETDREVLMTVTSDTGVVMSMVIEQVSLGADAVFGEEIDTTLGEFAIYAASELDLEKDASVSVWGKSPEAALRSAVKIGTAATSSSRIRINAQAELKNAQIYPSASSPASVRGLINSTGLTGGWVLPDIVPLVPVYLEDADKKLESLRGDSNWSSGNTSNFSKPGKCGTCGIYNGSRLVIDGASAPTVGFDNLIMASGGVIEIRGDVRLVIFGLLGMYSGSAIELAEGATLDLVIGDDLTVDASALGVPTSEKDPIRSYATLDAYRSPGRVRILGLDDSDTTFMEQDWSLENGSFAMASVHAPWAEFRLDEGTTLIGRITADEVKIEGDATLLYDPALDNRIGFTDEKSPLYDSGSLRAEYEPMMKFFKEIVEGDTSTFNTAETVFAKMYGSSRDQSAFMREMTSILLNENYRSTDDSIDNPFATAGGYMIDRFGMDYDSTAKELSNLADALAPSNSIDIHEILLNDNAVTDLLGSTATLVLKLLNGVGLAPDEVAETDEPKLEFAKPDADGNYTLRRPSKAISRTVDLTAVEIEDR